MGNLSPKSCKDNTHRNNTEYQYYGIKDTHTLVHNWKQICMMSLGTEQKHSIFFQMFKTQRHTQQIAHHNNWNWLAIQSAQISCDLWKWKQLTGRCITQLHFI